VGVHNRVRTVYRLEFAKIARFPAIAPDDVVGERLAV
jgi:hypothetical protein